MATQYYNFTGKCKWAKVYQPDQKYNVYSINVYLDEANLARYEKSGIQGSVKEDADGKYVVFRRPVAKLIKGDLVKFEPPKVTRKEGDMYVPITDQIGNGSEVTCSVAVYDTFKGRGHTLMSVNVRDLVTYTPPNG